MPPSFEGPLNGYLISHYSQWINCMIATALQAMGYCYLFTMLRFSTRGSWLQRIVPVGTCFSAIGIGSGLAFAVGLDNIVTSCTKATRGRLVAVVVALASLLSIPYAFLYRLSVFKDDVIKPSKYFLVIALTLTTAGLFAMRFTRRFGRTSTPTMSSTRVLAAGGLDQPLLGAGEMIVPGELGRAIRAAIRRPIFWLLVSVLFLQGGACGFHLWNIGNLVHSVQQDSFAETIQFAVLLWAGSAGIGPLLLGPITEELRVRRGWISAAICLVSVIASIFAIFDLSSLTSIYITTVGLAISYGCIWLLYPMLVADAFPIKDFSKIWGLLSLGPGVGNFLFNMIGGRLYEMQSAGRNCIGTACFRGSYSLILVSTTACLFLHIWIIPLTEYIGADETAQDRAAT